MHNAEWYKKVYIQGPHQAENSSLKNYGNLLPTPA